MPGWISVLPRGFLHFLFSPAQLERGRGRHIAQVTLGHPSSTIYWLLLTIPTPKAPQNLNLPPKGGFHPTKGDLNHSKGCKNNSQLPSSLSKAEPIKCSSIFRACEKGNSEVTALTSPHPAPPPPNSAPSGFGNPQRAAVEHEMQAELQNPQQGGEKKWSFVWISSTMKQNINAVRQGGELSLQLW